MKQQQLRLQVAQLESPERVVDDAQKLGMVPPATVRYLSPDGTAPTPTTAPTRAAAPKTYASKPPVATTPAGRTAPPKPTATTAPARPTR